MRASRGKQRRSNDAPAAIGQCIELDLERLTHDGRGIGYWQGRTLFVDGGLPGERVTARVVKARSKLIETRLERVQQASGERQQPACAHAALCGGCSLQHMSAETQLQIKQQTLAQQLQHFAGLQPEQWMPALTGPVYAYRQRSRLSLRWQQRDKTLQVGFRQRFSSDLVEVSQCPVLVPALESLMQALIPLLKQLEGAADLGHVELIDAQRPLLLLRHMQPLSAADLERLQAFAAAQDVGCWLQPGDEDSVHCVWPEEAVQPAYALPELGLSLAFQPGDFIQVNAGINRQMIAQALAWLAVEPGEAVLDLFCGLGNFALPLAQAGARVTAVEGSQAMVGRATANALENQLNGLHFYQADLSKPVDVDWFTDDFAAAVLDPPRDGAELLVQQLAARGVGRILYVSCNPATLARDAGLLAAQGYRLVQAGIMDMFPQTAHVEAMALFVAGGKRIAAGAGRPGKTA